MENSVLVMAEMYDMDDMSATTIVFHDAYRRFRSRYGGDSQWRFDFESIYYCPYILFPEVEYSDTYPSCYYLGGEVPADVLQKMNDHGVHHYPADCSLSSLTRGESYVVLFVASEDDHRAEVLSLLARSCSVCVYYVDRGVMPAPKASNYRSHRLSEDGQFTYKERAGVRVA